MNENKQKRHFVLTGLLGLGYWGIILSIIACQKKQNVKIAGRYFTPQIALLGNIVLVIVPAFIIIGICLALSLLLCLLMGTPHLIIRISSLAFVCISIYSVYTCRAIWGSQGTNPEEED